MTEKGTFKKENMKDEHFDVARTRKCAECGPDEKMCRMWPGRGNEVVCTPPLVQPLFFQTVIQTHESYLVFVLQS